MSECRNKASIVLPVLAVVALINIMPLLIYHIGGDIVFHLVAIDCFGQQFWQGNLYPRWCMSANAGLGNPLFIFYSPFSYYAPALLYPLTRLGVTLNQLYIFSMWLATLLTGLTCYRWLKDIVSPGRALLAAIVFLFMPYRLEAMFFRSAYAETWLIALLPLLFMYARRLAKGEGGAAAIAAIAGLMFLTNIACGSVGLVLCGIYLLAMSWPEWRIILRFVLAGAWGAAFAAFYIFPALYYRQFVATTDQFITTTLTGWPNTYLDMDNVTLPLHGRIVIMIGLTAASLTVFSLFMLRRPFADLFIRREIRAWILTAVATFYLLFPISAPIYALMGPLGSIVYPWRMQIGLALCGVFLLAIWMQWSITPRRMKTWQGDFTLLMLFMTLAGYSVVTMLDPKDAALAAQLVRIDQVDDTPMRTSWTDKEHYNAPYMLGRDEHKKDMAPVDITAGKGTVSVDRWGWRDIVLQTESAKGMSIRLDHTYFPIWEARDETGAALALHPENGSGQILMDVPRASHRITLSYAISHASPLLIGLSYMVSLSAALFWLFCVFGHRRDKALAP